jgi:hypothetical protein
VVKKFISHPLFNNMFFDYLVDFKNVKQNHEVLLNKKAKIIYKTFSGSKEV